MCEFCKGLGWILTQKPMLSPRDGMLHMIGIPQPCIRCDAYLSHQRGSNIAFGNGLPTATSGTENAVAPLSES